MSYAILCDARKGHNMGVSVLALVDRTRSKRSWWTSDGHEPVMVYRKLSAAKFAARRLRKNNARVVKSAEAFRALSEQSAALTYHEALADCELGWDEHK